MEINVPLRAKEGWIETERVDRYGKRSNQKVKQHIVSGSGGVFSVKEMEGVMREVAAEVGASEDQIHVSAYGKDKAPVEANPRHRGLGQRWEKRPDEPTEVGPRKDHERTTWGGFGSGTITRYQIED